MTINDQLLFEHDQAESDPLYIRLLGFSQDTLQFTYDRSQTAQSDTLIFGQRIVGLPNSDEQAPGYRRLLGYSNVISRFILGE